MTELDDMSFRSNWGWSQFIFIKSKKVRNFQVYVQKKLRTTLIICFNEAIKIVEWSEPSCRTFADLPQHINSQHHEPNQVFWRWRPYIADRNMFDQTSNKSRRLWLTFSFWASQTQQGSHSNGTVSDLWLKLLCRNLKCLHLQDFKCADCGFSCKLKSDLVEHTNASHSTEVAQITFNWQWMMKYA